MKGTSFGLGVALVAATVFVASRGLAQGEEPAPPPPPDPPPTEEPPPPAPPAEPPPAEPPPAPPAAEPPPAQPPIGAQGTFGASTQPQADTGVKPAVPPAAKPKPKKLVWRATVFEWDNSATSETVGIGQDTQSRNPTYDMTFSLKPRYYVYDDDDQNISLRGEVGVFREFTNSDATTRRGEWSFADTTLLAAYTRILHKDGDYKTDLSVRMPTLVFPTSKVSANNGRILSLGASTGASQTIPVLGGGSDVLQTANFGAVIAYSHWFTEATTPTNEDLDRVRMDPEGRALPGDQLSSAAFAKHQMSFTLTGELAIHERVTWGNTFSVKPAWKYTFDDKQQVCNVATGCVTPDRVDDPQRLSVITLFGTEVAVDVLKELGVAVGYQNMTLQLGPDGQRRNFFYSPDARVYFTATAKLDEIYKTASGLRKQEEAAKTPSKRRVAKQTPR